MKTIDTPLYFCELSGEDIDALEHISQQFKDFGDVRFLKYLYQALLLHEGCSDVCESEMKKISESFICNLALESMRRRGLVLISKKTYLLDRDSDGCEIGLGLRFHECR